MLPRFICILNVDVTVLFLCPQKQINQWIAIEILHTATTQFNCFVYYFVKYHCKICIVCLLHVYKMHRFLICKLAKSFLDIYLSIVQANLNNFSTHHHKPPNN